MMKPGQPYVFLSLVGLLLLATAAVFWYKDHLLNPKELAVWVRSFGMWAPVLVIALMIIHSFVPFPAELLAICAGAVFGTVLGSALIWSGAMLGAVLSFGLSRALGRDLVRRYLPTRHFATLDKWTDEQGAFTLLISRFIPVIAFNLINYAAGLTRVSFWTFVWTTSLGILPITVLSVYLGAQMRDLSWSLILSISLAGIAVIWLFQRLAKKRGWI
jgi:uncharacterized membrane protein YdjX (TVP38/TMEM64 family)